ncbi:hypothetical protein KC332_g8504 [Hortaea werneckii]|nr:hypothetical protein KC358_g7094 [Hortaea werneckii]KAI6834284.1 hypothetical protein KC350_g6745 [Hortaea werneckii]KAI6930526.1 hypothetical protein KC348_g7548 [Hortaea werneckii]KAI6939002.1 hypothetical protein KC341_g4504 [Hortaea werneckii]KAI6960983.1 hypothetical protein KC329_g16855 [Hortaea werneckii]
MRELASNSHVEADPWNFSPFHTSLVTISDNATRLNTTVQGPPRRQNQPVIVFISGGFEGGYCWARVANLLAPNTRSVRFDQAGTGQSSTFHTPRSAENIAQELEALLQTIAVRPPYILVAHSYGGIVAREFLALHSVGPEGVVGMVLVDTNTEHSWEASDLPLESFGAIMRELDFGEVSGLKACLTEQELEAVKQDEKACEEFGTEEAGIALMHSSAVSLAKKRQLEETVLGDVALTVILGDAPNGMWAVVGAAEEDQIGTPEQRREVRVWAERFQRVAEPLQREQMRLSRNARWVEAKKSGHHVQLQEPDLVVDEIEKIMAKARLSFGDTSGQAS